MIAPTTRAIRHRAASARVAVGRAITTGHAYRIVVCVDRRRHRAYLRVGRDFIHAGLPPPLHAGRPLQEQPDPVHFLPSLGGTTTFARICGFPLHGQTRGRFRTASTAGLCSERSTLRSSWDAGTTGDTLRVPGREDTGRKRRRRRTIPHESVLNRSCRRRAWPRRDTSRRLAVNAFPRLAQRRHRRSVTVLRQGRINDAYDTPCATHACCRWAEPSRVRERRLRRRCAPPVRPHRHR